MTTTETSNTVRTNMVLEQLDTNSSKKNDIVATSSEKSGMDIQAEITEFVTHLTGLFYNQSSTTRQNDSNEP